MKTQHNGHTFYTADSVKIGLVLAFLLGIVVTLLVMHPMQAQVAEGAKQSAACPDDLEANMHVLVRSQCFNPTDGCLELAFEMIGFPIELHRGGR